MDNYKKQIWGFSSSEWLNIGHCGHIWLHSFNIHSIEQEYENYVELKVSVKDYRLKSNTNT